MLLINAANTSPYFNLAMEEYILSTFTEDCFLLWRDIPCVIVGKNQNTISEINLDYIKEHNIPVVRRLTGGGAVFHDLGNVNFTFTSVNKPKDFNDFRKFTLPIIEYLKSKGISAEFSGRNDLTIDGRKFSGNAECNFNHNVMHHGTLLFSSEITDLSNALKVKPIKLKSNGVKSVVSRVTNISEHLKTPMDVIEFKEDLFNFVKSSVKDGQVYKFTDHDNKMINELVKNKYSTWEWNFGQSPKYELTNSIKYIGGNIDFYLDVRRGIINDIKIYGDFFGILPISDIENHLIGTVHNEKAIRDKLSNIKLQDYFAGITDDEFIKGILGIH